MKIIFIWLMAMPFILYAQKPKPKKFACSGIAFLWESLNYGGNHILIKNGDTVILTELIDKHTWWASFDGEYFQSQGGYIKKDANDIKLNIIADQNEKRITANEKSLLRATWFAGIVATLLLLWQIFLYFYPVHEKYPYFFWH